ncbi:hypothetical protein M404DRAFT_994295 [Pisolithus tinctorius Marx 270]|uniref:Uncharacterized protein n=1 Tax=Pisolithus tinctorius Marx 270 TaxID=870435 RepID=A0A0C3PCN8_PISTI|nr:hypothetical protein M404DRAFT_994295 [Pisolithus tinctorius Marx 270]
MSASAIFAHSGVRNIVAAVVSLVWPHEPYEAPTSVILYVFRKKTPCCKHIGKTGQSSQNHYGGTRSSEQKCHEF